MSKPKLPSQKHPDYPKGTYGTMETNLGYIKAYVPPKWEEYKDFYDAHPEFYDEGEYELRCPYCGNGVEESGPEAACCGEYARGEWVLMNYDGTIKGE